MDKKETLFKTGSKVDSKSKLNKLDKTVDNAILEQIENGVTLEQLDKMAKSGLPILKYNTQITIHGLFPELSNNYIFGYKNIFQNKNKSIGVKYNAIDEAKRQRIADRVRVIDMRYTRNSTNTVFSITRAVNENNFEAVKSELITLKGNIDTNLFYGSVHIWKGSMWGQIYLGLDLHINAIYERNIETLLNSMGASIEAFNEAEARDKAESEAREREYAKQREASDLKRKQALESNTVDLDILNQHERVTKSSEPGFYVIRSFDYNDNLVYKAVYIYTLKGKKKPRFNRAEYLTLPEALNHECKEGWSDSIYSGRVTGYRITDVMGSFDVNGDTI